MPNDAEQRLQRATASALADAVEALLRVAETLTSLGLHQEADNVTALASRLQGNHSGTGPSVFRREGEYRLVIYGSDVFRLRETLGLSYLARLLSSPGHEVHVLELVGGDARLSSDAGPILDAEARRAYRERIDELRSEVADAERGNDLERAELHRREIEMLRAELLRAGGLAGRTRTAGSATERARQAATKAMKSALARIAAHSPAMSQHLASTVRTGTYCRYDPDPRLPIVWRI